MAAPSAYLLSIEVFRDFSQLLYEPSVATPEAPLALHSVHRGAAGVATNESYSSWRKVIKDFDVPTVLHGCECWTLSRTVCDKLNVFQSRCLGTTLGLRWQDQSRTGCKFLTGQGVQEGAAPLCRKDFFLSLLLG